MHIRRLRRHRPGAPWLCRVSGPVTVLVPAYNEEAGIESTLRSLLASTYRELQIIVIDDGSTNRTPSSGSSSRWPTRRSARSAAPSRSPTGLVCSDLSSLMQTVRRAAGGTGQRVNVPVAAVGIPTSRGSVVKWDAAKARRLFTALRNDGPVPGGLT